MGDMVISMVQSTTCRSIIITSKLKMSRTFQGIRNDRKSKETSGITGESD